MFILLSFVCLYMLELLKVAFITSIKPLDYYSVSASKGLRQISIQHELFEAPPHTSFHNQNCSINHKIPTRSLCITLDSELVFPPSETSEPGT